MSGSGKSSSSSSNDDEDALIKEMVRYSKEIKKVQDEALGVLEQGLKTRDPKLIDKYQLMLRQAEKIQDAVNDMNQKLRTLQKENKKK